MTNHSAYCDLAGVAAEGSNESMPAHYGLFQSGPIGSNRVCYPIRR
jgi:hypothetical protein